MLSDRISLSLGDLLLLIGLVLVLYAASDTFEYFVRNPRALILYVPVAVCLLGLLHIVFSALLTIVAVLVLSVIALCAQKVVTYPKGPFYAVVGLTTFLLGVARLLFVR